MVKVTTGDRSVLLHLLLCVVFLLINSYLSLVSHYVHNMQLIYENLPSDISGRHVLLLDPVLATGLNFHTCTNIFFPKFLTMNNNNNNKTTITLSGNSAVQAINLLISKGAQESNIIFLNLISVCYFDPSFLWLSENSSIHFSWFLISPV